MKKIINILLFLIIASIAIPVYGDIALKLKLCPTEGGQLKKLLGNRKYFVEDLTIKGVLNDEDYDVLWEASYSGTLKTLNLREAEIKSIPDSAFYHADVQGDPAKGGFKPIKLKHLILPQKITKILSYAFYGVPLESVNWDDTEIAWIYEYAFTYNKLRSVRLPHWDFNVFDYAFAFSDVEEVYLYGPYSLGKSAFEGCKNLKSICLPLTMYAQEKIFYDCDIREVILPPNTAYYNISKHYLGNNKNLHSLKFDSECHIHEYAFEGCDLASFLMHLCN